RMADKSIQTYCEEENLVGISDIDTRSLDRHIRDKGAMNAIIFSEVLDLEELKSRLAVVPSMVGLELSSLVSTKEPISIVMNLLQHVLLYWIWGLRKTSCVISTLVKCMPKCSRLKPLFRKWNLGIRMD